jgi:hypothetical protein
MNITKDREISYQASAHTNQIMTNENVNANTIQELITCLRANNPPLKNLTIPTIEDAQAHGTLPTVVFSGVYSTRSASGLSKWNGVVALDLDPVKELKMAHDIAWFEPYLDKVIDIIKDAAHDGDPLCLYGFIRSKSGKGYRLLFAVNPLAHRYASIATYYKDLYNALATVVNNLLSRNGITQFFIDDQASDISHPFALVADRYAEYYGKALSNNLLNKLLNTYTRNTTLASGNILTSIDVNYFKYNVSVTDFKLKDGVTLTQYDTTYKIANILSYLYGESGRALYESYVRRDNKNELRPTWKGYFTTGLQNAAKQDPIYSQIISKQIQWFTNNTVKQVYTYISGFTPNAPAYRLIEDIKFPGFTGKLHINKYLSERENHIVYAIKKFKHVILKSETGTGKTTLMKSLVKHFTNDKIDIIAPTLSIVQQQDIIQITGNKKLTAEQENAPIIATTYSSINKIEIRGASICIIDEGHHLADDYSPDFKKENIEDIMQSMSRYEYVIICTGTAHNLTFKGFTLIDVIKDTYKPLSLTEGLDLRSFINMEHVVGERIEVGKGSYKFLKDTHGNEVTYLKTIYVTTKETGNELVKLLIGKGYKSNEVVFLNADTKSDNIYKTLVSDQVLPCDIKVLITTKLLSDGVNINNNYQIVDVYYYPTRKDNLSFNEIKQYSARFRTAIKVNLFTSSYASKEVKPYYIPTYNQLVRKANDQNMYMVKANDLLYASTLNGDTYTKQVHDIHYTYINKVTGQHEVNEVQLVRQHQTRLNQLFRNDINIRKAVLKDLGITLLEQSQKRNYQLNKDINSTVKELSRDKKSSDRASIVELVKDANTKLVTDRYQRHLVNQYHEMISNGFHKEHVIDIIKYGTGDKISTMVKTSRFLHNYKLLDRGTKPKINCDLTGNDLAMIAFYIQAHKYFFKNNITDFSTSDPILLKDVSNIRKQVNKKFSSTLSYAVNGAELISLIQVFAEVEDYYARDKEGKIHRKYRILKHYILQDFAISKPQNSGLTFM